MEEKAAKQRGLSSSTLHLLAMAFMLIDHMWATVTPGHPWMNCVGRMAFPLFAFLLVEGFFHTHDYRRYLLRMVIFALVSEIPFNLMYGASLFWPLNQSVYVTLLVALLGLGFLEKVKAKGKIWLWLLAAVPTVLFSSLLTILLFADYHGAGILMVYVFYFFRGRKWWQRLGQFVALYLIADAVGGLCYLFTVFGHKLEIARESFSLLALPFLWLHDGRKGIKGKAFQYFCYAFYPLHILILALLMLWF